MQQIALATLRSYKYKTTRCHNPEMLDMITHYHHNPNPCVGD